MANAPKSLGGDLTNLDNLGKQLLSNEEVIAVDRPGQPARQILGGGTPVWGSAIADGTYYVALFNLNAFPLLSSCRGALWALQMRRTSATCGITWTFHAPVMSSVRLSLATARACCSSRAEGTLSGRHRPFRRVTRRNQRR